ncbi:MAG: hypothetical protein AABX59_02745 [Nanoarchaeota archaeon]
MAFLKKLVKNMIIAHAIEKQERLTSKLEREKKHLIEVGRVSGIPIREEMALPYSLPKKVFIPPPRFAPTRMEIPRPSMPKQISFISNQPMIQKTTQRAPEIRQLPQLPTQPERPVTVSGYMPSIMQQEKVPVPTPAQIPQQQFPRVRPQIIPIKSEQFEELEIPTPAQEFEEFKMPKMQPGKLDLGILNQFVQDNAVSVIKFEDGQLKVTKKGEEILTDIALEEEEAKTIIKNFSIAAGKEISGHIFEARIENLRIHAIISDVMGTRFVINKEEPIPSPSFY